MGLTELNLAFQVILASARALRDICRQIQDMKVKGLISMFETHSHSQLYSR